MKGHDVTNYEQKLDAAKRKLRHLRNKEKAEKNTPFEDFYFFTAQTLRTQFNVQVSAGWVREQCTKNTDPSYLRVGALMNFLAQYQDDTGEIDDDPRTAEQQKMTEEEAAEERDRELEQKIRAQIEARGSRTGGRKPNAWMKQLEAAKREAERKKR